MTKPIEGVSERILSCAKEGFLEKGYADASLRTIAAKAETTTGSIYSRFRDKEGLFGALVEPAAGGRTLEILNESDCEYFLNGNNHKGKEMFSFMGDILLFSLFNCLLSFLISMFVNKYICFLPVTDTS